MIYQSLAENTCEIRLLKVLPNEDFNAKVECQVNSVSFPSGTSYIALSYAWGDPKIKAGILVNGAEHIVTINLESALRQIRQNQNESLFWIDAICIDQTNFDERTSQVRLMGQIYSNVEVLIWLGVKSDDSDIAMNVLAYWHFRYVLRGTKPIIPHVIGSIEPQEWEALKKLIQRPWLSRLWCLQELVLAKEVSVQCGSKVLPWTCFFVLQMIVKEMKKPEVRKLGLQGSVDPSDFGILDEKVAIRLEFLPPKGKGHSLSTLLCASQTLENSEPLDKVYALLGIASDASDFDSPDYARSVSEVYANVTQTIIQRDRDLSLIMAGGIPSTRDIRGDEIPSWVPDWSQGNRKWQYSLIFTPYYAAKDTKAISSISSALKGVLSAQGILYDKMTSLEKPAIGKVEGDQMQRILFATGRPGPYTTRISKLQAFFRTILLDRDPLEKTFLTTRSNFSFEMACGFIGFILSVFRSYPALSWLDIFITSRTHYNRLEALLRNSKSSNANLRFVVLNQFDSLKCYADYILAFIQRYAITTLTKYFFITKKGYLGITENLLNQEILFVCFLGATSFLFYVEFGATTT